MKLDRVQVLLERVLVTATVPCVVFILVVTVVEVILRRIGAKAIPGSYELIVLLVVAVIYLALPEAHAKDVQVKVSIVYDRLPDRVQKIATALTSVITLIFFVLLTWYTGKRAWSSWLLKEYEFGVISFPLYPSKALVPFSCFILCMRLVLNVWQHVKDMVTHE
jgi:TRAP-type C4-dicarboxylate transport system permease small subunit